MANTSNVSNSNLEFKEILLFTRALNRLGPESFGLHAICYTGNYTGTYNAI